jgi:hypothetical protein
MTAEGERRARLGRLADQTRSDANSVVSRLDLIKTYLYLLQTSLPSPSICSTLLEALQPGVIEPKSLVRSTRSTCSRRWPRLKTSRSSLDR